MTVIQEMTFWLKIFIVIVFVKSEFKNHNLLCRYDSG